MSRKKIPQLSQLSDIAQRKFEADAPNFTYIRGEGCGNTFLIFDCLGFSKEAVNIALNEAHSLLLKEGCDDALILKRESETKEKLVLSMIVLEPDRSIAEFCGNGARVVSCYLQHKLGNNNLNFYLKTSRGLRKIWWENQTFFVEMGKTRLRSSNSKFFSPQYQTFSLGLGLRQFNFFWTETLEPHLVTFDEIDEDELFNLGLYLNLHQRKFFPLGINLNQAKILSETSLQVITFERGVNRITAACGTGATSSAILAKERGLIKGPKITVLLKGGFMQIHPKKDGAIMSGPASIEMI